jgi:hypothetical protein
LLAYVQDKYKDKYKDKDKDKDNDKYHYDCQYQYQYQYKYTKTNTNTNIDFSTCIPMAYFYATKDVLLHEIQLSPLSQKSGLRTDPNPKPNPPLWFGVSYLSSFFLFENMGKAGRDPELVETLSNLGALSYRTVFSNFVCLCYFLPFLPQLVCVNTNTPDCVSPSD